MMFEKNTVKKRLINAYKDDKMQITSTLTFKN